MRNKYKASSELENVERSFMVIPVVYVNLEMERGNFLQTKPCTSWSKRYFSCSKAKTFHNWF